MSSEEHEIQNFKSDEFITTDKDSTLPTGEKIKFYKSIEQDIKQALLSENLIVLTGAGSSKGNEGQGAGKLMGELWDIISKLSNFEAAMECISYNKEEKNLEKFLSSLQIEKQAKENKKEIDDKYNLINEFIVEVEKKIAENCNFPLPEDFPHAQFLRKLIKARKTTIPRLKIFTLNYDTCFEQAANKIGAVVIDGFNFTQEGEFKSTVFDLDIVYREQSRIHNEENFFSKVFHLYKIHGSVNWTLKGERIVKEEGSSSALLIYPNSSKFESSYKMPFFEMISRFQFALRKQNTALMIIGYGFNDEHINRIIDEALQTNLNLKIFVVNPNLEENPEKMGHYLQRLIQYDRRKHNGLKLIEDSFLNFSKNIPDINVTDMDEKRESYFKTEGDQNESF